MQAPKEIFWMHNDGVVCLTRQSGPTPNQIEYISNPHSKEELEKTVQFTNV